MFQVSGYSYTIKLFTVITSVFDTVKLNNERKFVSVFTFKKLF